MPPPHVVTLFIGCPWKTRKCLGASNPRTSSNQSLIQRNEKKNVFLPVLALLLIFDEISSRSTGVQTYSKNDMPFAISPFISQFVWLIIIPIHCSMNGYPIERSTFMMNPINSFHIHLVFFGMESDHRNVQSWRHIRLFISFVCFTFHCWYLNYWKCTPSTRIPCSSKVSFLLAFVSLILGTIVLTISEWNLFPYFVVW